MWNSYKLYRASKDTRRYLSKENQLELNAAIDIYGVDSGAAILAVFLRLFSPEFMREFWNGNDKEFKKALTEHEALL